MQIDISEIESLRIENALLNEYYRYLRQAHEAELDNLPITVIINEKEAGEYKELASKVAAVRIKEKFYV